MSRGTNCFDTSVFADIIDGDSVEDRTLMPSIAFDDNLDPNFSSIAHPSRNLSDNDSSASIDRSSKQHTKKKLQWTEQFAESTTFEDIQVSAGLLPGPSDRSLHLNSTRRERLGLDLNVARAYQCFSLQVKTHSCIDSSHRQWRRSLQ